MTEGNDIEHLTAVIAEERKNIQDLQVAIDRDHDKIKDTAYYVWIPFIGTIAGVTKSYRLLFGYKAIYNPWEPKSQISSM
ncbi:hypothetical protein CBS147333_10373 [Penicillium roqueforti]|nr:hypothetical protein CBS147333_10373 [Penicillium roqueforti]